jgi:hypothetical protein
MAKHIWEWDKVSEKPIWVVCIRCGQRERLHKVLREIGCNGCPVEAAQGKLLQEGVINGNSARVSRPIKGNQDSQAEAQMLEVRHDNQAG